MTCSLQLLLTFGLLEVTGTLFKPAQEALLSVFSKETTAVMTHVPGPAIKHKLCGTSVEETLF
jgi:hypothetical protein